MAAVNVQLAEVMHPPSKVTQAVAYVRTVDWKTLKVGVIIGLTVGSLVVLIIMNACGLFKPASKQEVLIHSNSKANDRLTVSQRAYEEKTWKLIHAAQQHPERQDLDLSEHVVNDKIMSAVAQMHGLEFLRMENCQGLTDHSLAIISVLPRLKALQISGKSLNHRSRCGKCHADPHAGKNRTRSHPNK